MSDDKVRPRQLGRGLEALFGEDRTNVAQAESETGFRRVPIGRLIPNPLQPRRHFDDAALKDLTASIREKGILQPLIVRPTRSDPDTFEIVAGERRWRAAQRAQVHEAPVIIRDFTDEEALAVALIENIQRDELSPLEEAEAYARLSSEFGKTQEEVAVVVGKSRSHVSNMTRLLDLPEDVRALLATGELSAGHARAILRAPDPAALARQIVAEGLNVRDAEKLGQSSRGRRRKAAGATAKPPARHKDSDTMALERELGNILGLRVDVEFDGKGGRLTLMYGSLEQLDDLIERLTGPTVRPRGPGGSGSGQDSDFDDGDFDDGNFRGGDFSAGAFDDGAARGAKTGAADGLAGPPRPSGASGRAPYHEREDPPWQGAQRYAPDEGIRDPEAQNPDRALSEPPDDR